MTVSAKFCVHSSFIETSSGRPLIPDGLEWGLAGRSELVYVPLGDSNNSVTDSPEVRRGILEAQNRWCFAKNVPFKRLEDIQSIRMCGPHVRVEWRNTRHVEHTIKFQDISALVKEHKSAKGEQPPAQVWMNGTLVDHLSPNTLPKVLNSLSNIQSRKVCYKQSQDGKVIRIDRFFRGGLYHREEVFDHIMDNMIALEDPVQLDDNTLIGTATLPDWIMGGMLSSRLYIQEQKNGNILFLRPLYKDDIQTSGSPI